MLLFQAHKDCCQGQNLNFHCQTSVYKNDFCYILLKLVVHSSLSINLWKFKNGYLKFKTATYSLISLQTMSRACFDWIA